jgi:hypothetical protein
MSDIVERLRAWGTGYSVHKEAAHEIERLRAERDALLNRFGGESNDDAATRWVKTAKEAAAEIEKLRVALRVLNDLIVYLDTGQIELHRVRQFIESTLGEKE